MTAEEMEKAILSEIDEDSEAFIGEPFCTIDPNTRVITVPASLSLLGTESDKKTNRIHFRCPRVVGDNVDLSNFQICINFRNANSEKDRYIVEDMMVDGDEIAFSWSLSRKVTKYKGRVSFVVCALNAHEGNIENEWNTTLAFGTVLEGLEADEVNLDEEEKDIILQLLAMVDAKSNKALEEIEAAKNAANEAIDAKGKETLDSIPDSYEALQEDVTQLRGEINDLLYEPIEITELINNVSTAEMGSTVNEVTISWKTNKNPTSLTLDGTSIDVSETNKELNGLGLTANKSWKLVATDERDATAEKTTTLKFYNGVDYGVAAESTYDSAFILTLTKVLSGTKARTITVNAGSGQYIYYCLPVRLGIPSFNVGGFDGGFKKVETISFTNASGYSENYDIWKSDNSNLGNTTVKVS